MPGNAQPHGSAAPIRDRQRLIMAYDGGETACGPPELDRQIRSLVECFEGTHVGIFQRCLGGIHAFQGSGVLEVDERLKPCVDADVDPLTVFVDECHKCGMQAWGSYRMNAERRAARTPPARCVECAR